MAWLTWMDGVRDKAINRKILLWSTVMALGVTALLVYQVSFNIEIYLSQPTTFSITLEPIVNFRLPPISICPNPAFEPAKLKEHGVDVSGNYEQVQDNLLTLKGLPDNYSVWQLWKEAHWDLGQVIESIDCDSSGLVGYKSLDKVSDKSWDRSAGEWYHSYSPMGPCLTLHLAPGITTAYISIEAHPYIRPCNQPKGVKPGFKDGLEPMSCDAIAEECSNTTCGFEHYIFYYTSNIEYVYVFYHSSSVDPPLDSANEDEIQEYSSRLYDGNYVLEKLERSPSIVSYPQLEETSLLKGSCVSDDSYSYGQCYQQLLASHIADKSKSPCRPVFPTRMNYTIAEACSSPKQIQSLYEDHFSFENQCLKKCRRRHWNYEFNKKYSSVLNTLVHAKSTNIKKVIELETYPLAQLFSDIGGSLGLFLGISLLYVCDVGIQLFKYFWQKSHTKSSDIFHYTTSLLRYIVILILSAGTCIHGLESIMKYMTQPIFTSVHLESSHSTKINDISLFVARRLASHTLGCRPWETTNVKCHVQCLLENAMREGASVTPFLNIDGLPLCRNIKLSIPRFEYIVPSQLIAASTISKYIEQCNTTCPDLGKVSNVTDDYGIYVNMQVNQNYYSLSLLQLVCSLGGIIGLHLGWSIIDIVDFFSFTFLTQCSQWLTEYSKRYFLKGIKILKIIVCIVGLTLSLLQLKKFLLHHQVTTSVNSGESKTMPLVLTICRWPPFSFDHLANHLGANASERLLRKLPKEARLPEVLQLMEEFPGNWSKPLDVLWEQSAWNISDVIEGFVAYQRNLSYVLRFCDDETKCLDYWRPVKTQLNRCFALNLTEDDLYLLEIILIFPESLGKADLLNLEPQLYYTLNNYGEFPLMNNMMPKVPYKRITSMFHLATYQGLNYVEGTNKSHSFCIHECMADNIGKLFSCRLPYVTWRPDLHLCNQSQYESIPGYFKGLHGIGQDWITLNHNEKISSATDDIYRKCHLTCQHFQESFTAFSTDTIYDPYPSLTVRLGDLKSSKVLKDEDRHTISQFLSDVGGLGGTTLGISLLLVLKDLLPKAWMKCLKGKDKRSNVFSKNKMAALH